MAKSKVQKEYLTKRHINSASKRGIREAINDAMAISGSVVAVEGSWVIRKYEDGTVKKIVQIEKTPRASVVEKVNKLASY